ncbi:dynamin family protein [Flavimaricola marinus]|uniref:GTPase Era n=1 Tax=Flavimaricola marinus TaxID=1819565 RepID=A0A238LC69_9RHOB|nr:dynamin family protein [Flavimaricola marinus]SMY07289.1 GTPase Era [Flavimaricola marinus]
MTSNPAIGRKPCIALMGEFSAGKSTLANLLIGQDPLPVQIVATQLPPVRISYGREEPFCVDHDGAHCPVDLHDLASLDIDRVAYIQIYSTEDLLRHCDLLDMPGISDPNISSDVWESMIDQADGVLWCSHATQAWRQSEAAVWAELPDTLYPRSLLLLTRADKLRSETDRNRVLRRVEKETDGLFRACLPISLLIATQEQENYARWAESGAETFVRELVSLIEQLNAEISGSAPSSEKAGDLRIPGFEGPMSHSANSQGNRISAQEVAIQKVSPRRIAGSSPRTQRPPPTMA